MKPFENSLGSSPTITGARSSATETLAEGSVLGNYRIVRLLGAGGMGAVYLAEHVLLKTRHALKTIRPEFAKQQNFAERFQREAKLATRLKHSHIVTCTEAGVANDTPYLVMDYIEGPAGEPLNLSQLLEQRRERGELLDEDEATAVGLEICKALDYAHSYRDAEITNGIIHRDLKPANILLDKDTKLYIADFGLARMLGEKYEVSVVQNHALSQSLGEQATLARQVSVSADTVGTFDYMSPEQREGRVADARSDVYAMGVILYELLTGRKVVGVPAPPSKVRPGLDPIWDEIILSRCLAYEPDERFATAGTMCRAIEGVRSKSNLVQQAAIGFQPLEKLAPEVSTPRKPAAVKSLVSAAALVGIGLAVWWFGKPTSRTSSPATNEVRGTTNVVPMLPTAPVVMPMVETQATIVASVANLEGAAITISCSEPVRILPLQVGQPVWYDSKGPQIARIRPELSGWQFVCVPSYKSNSYEIRVNQDGFLYAFCGASRAKTALELLGEEENTKWENATGAICKVVGGQCFRRKVAAGETIKMQGNGLQLAAKSIDLVSDGKPEATTQPVAPSPAPVLGAITRGDVSAISVASVWLSLDIGPVCNGDVICTDSHVAQDTFALDNNGERMVIRGNLASASWLRKQGLSEPGLPDDGRVPIPNSTTPGYFQVRMPPAKNAILLSGPEGQQPKPVTVELAEGERRCYSELAILHCACWGSGKLRVLLRYETSPAVSAVIPAVEWMPSLRPDPVPKELLTAGVFCNTDPSLREISAHKIPTDPQRKLCSLTFAFDSQKKPKGYSQWQGRRNFTVGIFAISARPSVLPQSKGE